MSDHFIFIPSIEYTLSGDAKVTVIEVETPEYIAKQLMLQEDLKELLIAGKFDGEALAEAGSDMPLMVAEADMWAEAFELAGWCGSDGRPIFPIEPEERPEIPDFDGGAGPCFTDIEMAAELGLF